MRFSQIIQLIIFTGIIMTRTDSQVKHLGENFAMKEITTISELILHPGKYYNRDVKIEGIIASLCTEEGCFIEVVSKDGTGEGIVVNFPELIHTFPTSCAGCEVVVEGMFYQKIYPKSRVLHWQGHSFRKGKTVPEYSLIKRMNAKAVDIIERKGDVPKPGEINSASVDRVDLSKMEYETDGFGCGKKNLAPGDSMEQHSSGNYREIIYCMEGELTVIKQGVQPITLKPGEMTYIPSDTKHAVKNQSDKPTEYFFVFARKIETEEKKHDH